MLPNKVLTEIVEIVGGIDRVRALSAVLERHNVSLGAVSGVLVTKTGTSKRGEWVLTKIKHLVCWGVNVHASVVAKGLVGKKVTISHLHRGDEIVGVLSVKAVVAEEKAATKVA